MEFNVSEGAAWAVLFSVLSVFTIIAFIASGWFGSPPILEKLGCILLPKFGNDSNDTTVSGRQLQRSESVKQSGTADHFLSARNSVGTRAIALSFFASGMGAWVVYGSTEMGANPALSWIGVLGYAGGSSLPALIIGLIGPRVRKISGENRAFATTDFAKQRFGRLMQLSVACISVFYMFIYLVSEMTSISNVYGLMVGVDTFDDSTISYTSSIAISLAVMTWFYTSAAGLPASIVTDKYQAGLMFVLVFILLVVACSNPANQVTKEEFAVASNWTADGAYAAVTLFIALACAELFNQGNWQRVWAAKSVGDMRKGFAWGSALVFLLMTFFGIMGMLAYAKDPEKFEGGGSFFYLAFFELIAPLSGFWHILVLIVVTALAASSADTLQNAIACIFSHDLLGFGMSDKKITWITRVLLLVINIPAVYMSSRRYDVIGLFLVADIVCATAVLPLFLGLITEDIGVFLPAPTELGSFLGIISGISSVLVIGKVLGFTQAESYGEVIATGPSSYFWLTNSDQCAVCGTTTMVTFIIVPLVAGFFALLFSKIDILIRGERAREPLFQTGFLFDTLDKLDVKVRGEDRAREHPIFHVDPKADSVRYNFSAVKADAKVGEDEAKADGSEHQFKEFMNYMNEDEKKGEEGEELGVETAKEEVSNSINGENDEFLDNKKPVKEVDSEVV